MGGTKVDFLHHAPSVRVLLKEPPYLWQLLSPDGGNLEHWAGGMERWWKREGRREGGWKRTKGSGGRARGREREQAKPQPCWEKQMAGGNNMPLSLCSTSFIRDDWFMIHTGGMSIFLYRQAGEIDRTMERFFKIRTIKRKCGQREKEKEREKL